MNCVVIEMFQLNEGNSVLYVLIFYITKGKVGVVYKNCEATLKYKISSLKIPSQYNKEAKAYQNKESFYSSLINFLNMNSISYIAVWYVDTMVIYTQ